MPGYVALLRAVNVAGTGKLPMTDLAAMCVSEGFANVRTYIASGNVVFTVGSSASKVKTALERRLEEHAGKPVGVLVRTAAEMAAVLEASPFPGKPTKFTVAVFLDHAPPTGALGQARGIGEEEMRLGKREIYVYYGAGIGRSKLRIPAAAKGTARNMNTIAKLVEMAQAIDPATKDAPGR